MKLVDYVIKNDEDIENIREYAEVLNRTLEDELLEGHCPSAFKCTQGTEYAKPFIKYKNDKTDCKYRYECDQDKCNKCWNRELLVSK